MEVNHTQSITPVFLTQVTLNSENVANVGRFVLRIPSLNKYWTLNICCLMMPQKCKLDIYKIMCQMSSFQGALNLIKLLDQIRRNNSISVCHFQSFLHIFHFLIFKFLLFALQNIIKSIVAEVDINWCIQQSKVHKTKCCISTDCTDMYYCTMCTKSNFIYASK